MWLSSNEASGQRYYYQKTTEYVAKVEKEGFSQETFRAFSSDVHSARKSFALYDALPQSLHFVSLSLLTISAGLVLFLRPRTKAL